MAVPRSVRRDSRLRLSRGIPPSFVVTAFPDGKAIPPTPDSGAQQPIHPR
jgi:hypothetical protein